MNIDQHQYSFFGQCAPSMRDLSPIGRRIVARINDGEPVPAAGFVWRGPRPAPVHALVPRGALVLAGAEEAA